MRRNLRQDTNPYCSLSTIGHLLLANPDGALVFHAPRACSQYGMAGFWNMKAACMARSPGLLPYFQRCHFFVTAISERDTIFGGEKKLEACLRDVAGLPEVRYIAVASGCTAGVMGDDIPAVCRLVEEDVGKPIIVLPGAGFMSDHFMKVRIQTMDAVIRRLAPPVCGDKEDSAVILGENRVSMGSDSYRELARYLSYFGIRQILVPPNAMHVKEFAAIARARLFLPVSYFQDGFSLMADYGDELAARYGAVCYRGNYPAGPAGVERFFTEVGRLLHQEEIGKKALQQEDGALAKRLRSYGMLSGKSYISYISWPLTTYSLSGHWELFRRAGMKLSAIVLSPRLKEKEKKEILDNPAFPQGVPLYEGTEALRQLAGSADLVLSTEAVEGVPHELVAAIRRAGLLGMENILCKAAAAVAGEGTVILHE